MVATRRSARIASQGSQNTSSPVSQASPKPAAGAKRKSEPGDSPSAKRGKKNQAKEQKTLEETLPTEENEKAEPQQQSEPTQKDVEMQDAPKSDAPETQPEKQPEPQAKPDEKHDDQLVDKQSKPEPKPESQPKIDEAFVKKPEEQPKQVEKPEEKTEIQPQEKGNQHDKTEDQQPQVQPKPNDKSQPQLHKDPIQETPQREKPKYEAPKQDTPKQDAPKQDAPKQDAPKQDAPKQDAPKQDAPKQDAPKQDAPQRHEPTHETPKHETPQQDMTKHEAPKQEAPQRAEPTHDAPKHQVPQQMTQNHTEKPEALAKDDPKPVQTSTNGDSAVIPQARNEEEPSNILEKGVIYFLYRGRVGIDDPSNVGDIARSYIILRPLPRGAKLGDGPIGDERNCRLLALPKKVLPLSGKDRWTAFVEKSNTSFKELKDSFLGPSDYQTQTAGVRHSPAAVPAAEGVYAITSTGRESHLAYMMTLPTSMGEIQNDLGLREKGSFVTSVKNPKYPGPAYADIGKDPGYSQEIIDEFRNLRWGPLQPKHLNYENCQFLLVGESGGIDKATGPPAAGADGQQPKEELERLEGEDEIRVKHLHGDDAVFADLGIDSKSYPGMQTTW